MKDKNGKIIEIGMDVDVPAPNETDMHNFDFRGYVEGLTDSYVVVLDGDGDMFMIEPERLEVVEE